MASSPPPPPPPPSPAPPTPSKTSGGSIHVFRSGAGGTIGGTSQGSTIDPIILQYVDAKMNTVKAEMTAELTKLEATIKTVEAQRSIDYKALADSISDVSKVLPTKETIRNYVLGGFGGVIAALALGWAVFDTGAGVAGSFADSILQTKSSQIDASKRSEALENKLDVLLSRQEASNSSGNKVDAKPRKGD